MLLCALLTAGMQTAHAQSEQPYPTDTINGTPVYRYTPEKSIGIYRISKRFGVPQDVIIQWNPQLQERGPQLGETLLIPIMPNKKKAANKETPAPPTPMPQTEPPTTIEPVFPTDSFPADISTRQENSPEPEEETVTGNQLLGFTKPSGTILTEETGSPLRIAIMLPIRANALERDANDDRFFDFYAGALIAIREAADEGQTIEVHLYDTDRSLRKIDEALADSFLHTADALIGPVYPAQAEYMAETILKDSLLTIIPFSDRVPSVENNPFLLQFNPTAAIEAATLTRYITQRENEINCVVTDAKDKDTPPEIKLLKEELERQNARISTTTIRQILNDSIDTALQDTMENLLIFNTERYGNLQVLMPHLTAVNKTHVLTLLSHYSWQKETIPLGQLYTSIFTNDSLQTRTAPYEAAWQKHFGYSHQHEHPRYDLLGYDLTRHLIGMLQQMQDIADPNYRETVLTRPYQGLQSEIHYLPLKEGSGYVNHGIQIQTR